MNPAKHDPISANRCNSRILLAIAAVLVLTAPVLGTRAGAAEPSPWVQLKGEKPALSLDQTALSGQPMDHFEYAHTNGSRSDWAMSGSLALAQPNLVVMITRRVQPETARSSVVRDMEDFGELKLVPHSYRPAYYALTTRFGELRGVAFDVNADGIQKHCIGFHTPEASKLFIKGFSCVRDQTPGLAKSVACLVDHIRYVSRADEEAINLAPADTRECGATALDGKNDGGSEKPAKDSL